jgi:tetratricopeptide (TPR) repeat protein
MRSKTSWWAYGISFAIVAVVATVIMWANRDRDRAPADPGSSGQGAAVVTSRLGLEHTITEMEQRLRGQPTNHAAAIALADALLREARVTGNAGLAIRAEGALTGVLGADPDEYDARRMLGAVYLSEHRFRDAIREGARTQAVHPNDDWNYGVIGDAHLELGEYAEAFAAFQRMMDLRPTAGAYARAAYALELTGHLDAALRAMKLATDATPPTDHESIAWHHAQLGDLYRQLGQPEDAAREYAWADASFPDHPFAERGMAALMESRGNLSGAVQKFEGMMGRVPSPDIAEKLGDLYMALGRDEDATRVYALAEAAWRTDVPQPAMLARFLAEHDRKLQEAVALAERAAADRHDIFTEDALAWCYFKSGRLKEAALAIAQARRTGTRDRFILFHAAAIRRALGDRGGATMLARAALEGNPHFDVRLGPRARALLAE